MFTASIFGVIAAVASLFSAGYNVYQNWKAKKASEEAGEYSAGQYSLEATQALSSMKTALASSGVKNTGTGKNLIDYSRVKTQEDISAIRSNADLISSAYTARMVTGAAAGIGSAAASLAQIDWGRFSNNQESVDYSDIEIEPIKIDTNKTDKDTMLSWVGIG
jgi:hypothetical protein